MKRFLLYSSVFMIIFGVSIALAQKPRPWHPQIIPGKILLPAPQILLPPPGKVFHNYPRKLLVKWQKSKRTGVKYDVLVKSPKTVMPDLILHPQRIEITGLSLSRG
jgi:hypothetical protein